MLDTFAARHDPIVLVKPRRFGEHVDSTVSSALLSSEAARLAYRDSPLVHGIIEQVRHAEHLGKDPLATLRDVILCVAATEREWTKAAVKRLMEWPVEPTRVPE